MPLPILDKTWEILPNITIPFTNTLDTSREFVLALKNAYTDPSLSFPWSVVGSSNSVAGGLDAVDRWTTIGNLVWANDGVAHSWIVLAQPQIAPNFQLLMSLNQANASGFNLTSVCTTLGFSGGSNTTNPTAADSVSPTTSVIGSVSTTGRILHFWQSSDGTCVRAIGGNNNVTSFLQMIERPVQAVAGWTNPYMVLQMASVASANANQILTTILYLAANGRARNQPDNGAMNLALSCEGFLGNGGFQVLLANPFNSEWPFFPIGLGSLTSGSTGRHGRLSDLWYGSAALANADYFPDNGTRQFVSLGSLILPWDGSLIQLAI